MITPKEIALIFILIVLVYAIIKFIRGDKE